MQDGNLIGGLMVKQYVNGFEQFILFARKEVEEDGELNSIEFNYNSNSQQNKILVSRINES